MIPMAEWKRKGEEFAQRAQEARQARLAREEAQRAARTPAQPTLTPEAINAAFACTIDLVAEQVARLDTEIKQLRAEIAELREQKIVRINRGRSDAA